MARKYLAGKNPAPVSDGLLGEARERLTAAQARLRAAEDADPGSPGWEAGYAGALAAARGAERRVEALEQLRAAQVERSGRRAAAVKAAAPDVARIAEGLAASRDQLAGALAAHLQALAVVTRLAGAHNTLLAEGRAELAARGLAVADDLAGGGGEHPEGTLGEGGVRAGGTDWTPVVAEALADHAMLQVFTDPLIQARRFRWRAHETVTRADGLPVPTLAGIGAEVPQPPRPPRVERMAVADGLEPPVLADGSGYRLERAAVGA